MAIAAAGDRIEVLRGDGGVIAPIILEAVAESSAVSLAGVGRAVVAETALGSVPDLDRLVRSIDAGAPSIAVRDATDRQGALSSSTSIAASMATLFLFFTAQFGVLGMLEERRTGTLARLFAAPVARWRVLAAKLAVSYVLGVGATAVLVAFSALLLGAEWGSLPGVVVLVLVGTLAAVSTSTLVLGVVTTAEQASAAQSMVGLVLGVVGGSFFSMTRAGGVAAIVTRLTPHHWFREGLVRLRSGGGIESLGVPVAALVAFAMVVGVPGLLLAARKVRP